MNSLSLAHDYFSRANTRRKAVQVLKDEGAHADVVLECQEIVELVLKGALRQVGIEPPKWHDVGQVLVQTSAAFPSSIQVDMARIVKPSSDLRKEREMSFYGAMTFFRHSTTVLNSLTLYSKKWIGFLHFLRLFLVEIKMLLMGEAKVKIQECLQILISWMVQSILQNSKRTILRRRRKSVTFAQGAIPRAPP